MNQEHFQRLLWTFEDVITYGTAKFSRTPCRHHAFELEKDRTISDWHVWDRAIRTSATEHDHLRIVYRWTKDTVAIERIVLLDFQQKLIGMATSDPGRVMMRTQELWKMASLKLLANAWKQACANNAVAVNGKMPEKHKMPEALCRFFEELSVYADKTKCKARGKLVTCHGQDLHGHSYHLREFGSDKSVFAQEMIPWITKYAPMALNI